MSNGKTQGSAGSSVVGAWPSSGFSLGTSTIASCGSDLLGASPPEGRLQQTPVGQPPLGQCADGKDPAVGVRRGGPRGSRPGRRALPGGEQGGEQPPLIGADRPVVVRPRPPCPGETGDDDRAERCGRDPLGEGPAAPASQSSRRAQPDPPEDEDARQHREYDAQHLEGVGGDVDHAAVPPGARHAGSILLHDVPRRTEQSRDRRHEGVDHQRHHRDRDQHPEGDHRPGPRLQDPVLLMEPPVRQQPEQSRPDPVVEIGDPGQVGQQVVAIEAQQRQQLLHHLEDLGRHQEQQRVPPGVGPPREGQHHHDRVEVQAAQVRTDASPALQPVAVGHVGVERRPHQIEADPDHARLGPAVARGRRVPELVEAPGEHGHHEHEQEQVRALEGVVRRRSEALVEEDPPRDRHEAEHDRQGQHRAEEDPERVGQPARDPGVGDGELEPETEQGVGPVQRRLRPVGQLEQPQRPQVLVDERRDHLLRDAPAHGPADQARDLGAGAPAVDRVQHEVEQLRELEGLPVTAAHQGRWGPVAGPHHGPDELEVIGARRRRADDRGHCGGVSVLGSTVSSPESDVVVAVVASVPSVDAVSVSGGSMDDWLMSDV